MQAHDSLAHAPPAHIPLRYSDGPGDSPRGPRPGATHALVGERTHPSRGSPPARRGCFPCGPKRQVRPGAMAGIPEAAKKGFLGRMRSWAAAVAGCCVLSALRCDHWAVCYAVPAVHDVCVGRFARERPCIAERGRLQDGCGWEVLASGMHYRDSRNVDLASWWTLPPMQMVAELCHLSPWTLPHLLRTCGNVETKAVHKKPTSFMLCKA